ncbi:MAG: dUTP diphosphatase [Spirochaetaceae bacterium]|jgi:dUTP pyrophosphatase|nr:dUTP diphosphatase [Spirochaetaceae bacterium]
MEKLCVKIIGKEEFIPNYSSLFAAGADLKADVDETYVLKPGERALISTGLKMEIPSGYEAQIRPRSGLAIKYGISLVNSPGTIDADYRGEVKVIMINHGNEDFLINRSDRIAQMIFAPVTIAEFSIVSELKSSERNSGGFGSTGK